MQEELKQLAKMIEKKMRENERDSDERGELIGELPIELLHKLVKLRKERDRLHEDMELRKHQLSLECQRKMEEEFDDRQDKYIEEHKAIWGEVYKCMLVDPNGSYFQEDGKLYAYGKQKKDEVKFHMIDFTKPSRR